VRQGDCRLVMDKTIWRRRVVLVLDKLKEKNRENEKCVNVYLV